MIGQVARNDVHTLVTNFFSVSRASLPKPSGVASVCGWGLSAKQRLTSDTQPPRRQCVMMWVRGASQLLIVQQHINKKGFTHFTVVMTSNTFG